MAVGGPEFTRTLELTHGPARAHGHIKGRRARACIAPLAPRLGFGYEPLSWHESTGPKSAIIRSIPGWFGSVLSASGVPLYGSAPWCAGGRSIWVGTTS